ncbi:hypothetical protein P691DRAFT_663864 [Macrolepiota fuliginosa MF-IS2]|uniref:Uncharacterized protein n=1 Tax=Macrolepiota fuliginosa MF-IS2 TaxID=1400762 RepID=A0A9P6C6S8_9AGAR|nr:hypothetical protein P691DRAFT_663864 [Macrolepiota fuliginosa MF-IS2]
MFHDAPILALNAHNAHQYLPQDKYDDSLVYVHQPHTVQIIQLVEGPPPPRNLPSFIDSSSSYVSSSACSDSWYDDGDDDVEEEEEEEVCESYCSSEEEEVHDQPTSPTDTYSLRMKRILAWRENFSAHLSATLSEPTLPSSLKRKLSLDEDDMASQSSKRSRSLAPSSVSSLGLHSCPACDASFDTEQSLRQHGTDATANEACSAAVEYAFE